MTLKSDKKERPRSGHHLSHSNSFLAIPKDKERLEEEIRDLKLELHKEKEDKSKLKTEFNRLREFLGTIKKERMKEARRAPADRKGTNSDLKGILEENNLEKEASMVSEKPKVDHEEQNTKLRLKMKKLKNEISQLSEKIQKQDEIILKHKSKTSDEVEYSAKLRKDILT